MKLEIFTFYSKVSKFNFVVLSWNYIEPISTQN